MNRCLKNTPALGAGVLAAALLLVTGLTADGAQAQMRRIFPQNTERGEISFVAPPKVLVNGQPERLGPGVRVRDERNMIPLSGALRGRTYPVHYLRDAAGNIREIWLITPDEANRPLPRLTGPRHQPASEPADPTLYAN